MPNTDALPALNVSERTPSVESQPNRFTGSQLLMESGSTDIVKKMTNDSMKNGSNDLLPAIGFTDGGSPNGPKDFPPPIGIFSNPPRNQLGQPADAGSREPHDSHSLHRKRQQPQERSDDRREGPSKPELMHDREKEKRIDRGDKQPEKMEKNKRPEVSAEQVKKDLDKLDISPEAKEIAKDLADAYGKGNLKEIVDGFSKIVKEHSNDPKTLKEAVDAFSKTLGKHGIPESMTVRADGSLVLGSGALTISPDGTVIVKPVHKVT